MSIFDLGLNDAERFVLRCLLTKGRLHPADCPSYFKGLLVNLCDAELAQRDANSEIYFPRIKGIV